MGAKAYEIGTAAFVKVIGSQRITNEIKTLDFMIRADITKRKFTKRQLNVLIFICNYSFNFGKRDAVFPQVKDFEVCGVSNSKIKEVLDSLVEDNVIQINKDEKRYSVNNPSEWKTVYHSEYKEQRTQELFLLNSRDANIGVGDLIKAIAKIKEDDLDIEEVNKKIASLNEDEF